MREPGIYPVNDALRAYREIGAGGPPAAPKAEAPATPATVQ